MTPEKLRSIYGAPLEIAEQKIINHLDEHCINFIENSTFLVFGTSDGKNVDLSPKGDPQGKLALIEDGKTLLIADRHGNKRLDGLFNILKYPKVSLLFFITNVTETLRVKGDAEITDEISYLEKFQINGKNPKTVTKIKVEKAFIHCGKALVRGKMWDNKTWPKKRPIAPIYQIIRDQTGQKVHTIDQKQIEKEYKEEIDLA